MLLLRLAWKAIEPEWGESKTYYLIGLIFGWLCGSVLWDDDEEQQWQEKRQTQIPCENDNQNGNGKDKSKDTNDVKR